MAEPKIDMASSVKFLLEEFRLLQELRGNATRQSETRVNIFFGVLTAIAGISILLLRERIESPLFLLSYSIFVSFMLILGILSFFRLLEAHISIVNYTRYLNRIRYFFVSHPSDLDIVSAISLPTSDKEPKYGGFGFGESKVFILGLTGIVIVMNSALSAALIGSFSLLFIPFSIYRFFPIGIAIFIVSVLIHFRLANRRFENEENGSENAGSNSDR